MPETRKSGLEIRLVEALQPVRYFVLAQVLHQFMETGLHKELNAGPRTVGELSESLSLQSRRLEGVLHYLANEGYLSENDGVFSLEEKARETAVFSSWYKLLVGGYSQTFEQLGRTLQQGAGFASRSGLDVGVGSCGISQYDAYPVIVGLLQDIRDDVESVVDLGCGDGSSLADLMELLPGLSAIGVDPEPESVRAGEELMRRRGLADRVRLRVAGAENAPELDLGPGPVCFISAFVLQELLEQQGREAVLGLVREVFTHHPDAHWIVIEVDNRIADRAAMAHRLALSYYNPYFLVHYLTEQRLERDAFWHELFAEAGAEVAQQLTADPRVDSTGFLLGYRLRVNAGGAR
ncbi:2-ketoarginine methyltransferase [Nocardiopsis sp. L17-MgMaSL7]|uniref:2-ketoarginine methyltransferase n=1 Tax=Nocardiopsis sp. L17-MgMaSL7 TaxID=1938893 RepID=UPI000D71091C|nr:2-ketoarginine methyltransferase [Nocardiopsis sp. L17-MgMaSL7]PWV51072.1 2-ketoarginine methyltransferase [Nocardiopsis sp. L17-MgMaSL7]